MENFEGLGLNTVLAESLARMQYNTPTPIQAMAIPPALAGRDILGSAQTGTGKTAAFSIPLVEALLRNPAGSALVLTPTRELGKQIMDILHQLLGPRSAIKTAFLIGGEAMGKQFMQLRARPRLIVGTPGRINDHLERGSLKLNDTGFLVLDETDRMLDMGFSIQLERIMKHMPAKRQTLMFSATMPHNIMALSKNYLKNPERIAVGATHNPAANIKQEVVRVSEEGKYNELIKQLDARQGSVVIFVKTKYGTERLAKKLNAADFSAEAIHGDLKQSRRDKVIRDFRGQAYRILVATDVAARGLDIPHIEHVINYDLPQVPEDYIHRIGRTARAGAEGSALCLITNADGRKWSAIERLMNPGAKSEQRGGDRGEGGGRDYARKKSGGGGGKFHRGKRPFAGNDNPYKRASSDENRAPKRFEGRNDDRAEGPSEGRSQERKPFGKPFGSKPPFKKKFDGDKPYGDKPRGDRPYGDRPYGKKPFSDKPRGDRPFGDKPRGDGPRGDAPQGEGKKFGGKPFGKPSGKPSGGPRNGRSFGGGGGSKSGGGYGGKFKSGGGGGGGGNRGPARGA